MLRNRKTETLLFVVSFTLVPIESSEATPASSEAGSVKGEDGDVEVNRDGAKKGPKVEKNIAPKDEKTTYVDEGVD